MSGKKKKELVSSVKLRIPAGKAGPAPNIASVLGQRGVNIMRFCKDCNEIVNAEIKNGAPYSVGDEIGVKMFLYSDKSFDIKVNSVSTVSILKDAFSIQKGVANVGKEFVKTICKDDIVNLAQKKISYTNAKDIEGAVKMLIGTAKSIGIKVMD
ncbi:MAG: ribosomal protein L11 [Candidatus Xenolissoclinum pacificiensis L6]|uniref:Large ribosomal subunit protein uL11 n=1 Tax=Candidatus Xenolissoclinum pacificiensis L6 TaxID=1401685 RepID=W2UYK1_9RICK|nr:MAG: ribosomal protein L11 [Candidatus Xenolissoclinum pacificiensis L6]